jgi:CheY-like chemotaxis protein/LmbE family N-acetylglucosaminyl deacetylase
MTSVPLPSGMHTQTPETGPRRVLLVEDDVDQAHLVKFLLEQDGSLSVTLVQDGIRAIQLLRDGPWDLLITDLNLPGADGIQVVEASRRHRPHLPILATTGYTGPEYGARARQQGADGLLLKPVDRDALLQSVRELLAKPAGGTPQATPTPEPAAGGGKHREVLVIGVRPGDAEAGCAGSILAHRRSGDRLTVLHLASELGDPSESGDPEGGDAALDESDGARDAIRSAGRLLGVRLMVTPQEGPGPEAEDELRRFVERTVRELHPDVLYIPTEHHRHPRHRAVHAAALAGADGVPTVLAYDPGDASPDFTPDRFIPLGDEELEGKVAATACYRAWSLPRLEEESVRTGAAFWGRYAQGHPVEALEVIREGGATPS